MLTPRKVYKGLTVLFIGGGIGILGGLSKSEGGAAEVRHDIAIGAACLVVCGILTWIMYFRTPEDPDEDNINRRPLAEQLDEAKKGLVGAMCLGPLYGYFVHRELWRLEHGFVASVTTWAPIAWAYETLGFWPAVLLFPTLCLYIAIQSVWRIIKVKNKSRRSGK